MMEIQKQWYLGSMSDGLFIIDCPPSPSGTDVPPGDYGRGPSLVLNVTDLPTAKAQAIVDAHNAVRAAALAAAEAQPVKQLKDIYSAAMDDIDYVMDSRGETHTSFTLVFSDDKAVHSLSRRSSEARPTPSVDTEARTPLPPAVTESELVEALRRLVKTYDGFEDGDGEPCPDVAFAKAVLANIGKD